MNRDFAEMLAALLAAKAEFLVVGAYAMAVHARPRATGDIDLWVNPTPENAPRVWSALEAFGAPLERLRPEELQSNDLIFQIGVPPSRVDILTGISGLTFAEAWPDRVTVVVEGHNVPVLGRAALLRNKAAAGRPRDLADIAELLAQDERGGSKG